MKDKSVLIMFGSILLISIPSMFLLGKFYWIAVALIWASQFVPALAVPYGTAILLALVWPGALAWFLAIEPLCRRKCSIHKGPRYVWEKGCNQCRYEEWIKDGAP